jgi:hypothetical protein
MSLTIRTQNWIYVLLAYTVSVAAIFWWGRPPDTFGHSLIQALAFTFLCAAPGLAFQRWRATPRAYHAWTLGIALVLSYGLWYGGSH